MAPGMTVKPENVRNFALVAHVDHGKSSFADSLLAANNIISSRLAGTIRYLDSREDEQERGITMESSAVSLGWRIPTQPTDGSAPVLEEYRMNLIDTPGHVDFSSEVSTASRLCDGALVLVDAVEGVCTQTITVLRQTHLSHLRPILVINKIDRLITELKLSPSEAYYHLSRLIEDVNAIVGSFYAGERMADDLRWHERQSAAAKAEANDGVDEEYQERDDSALYFDPANGTVLFASAIDGWAFRISRFAQLYAAKLGMSEANLNRCLWGDWYLDPKLRRVVNRKQMQASGRKLKPLFVQFVLENIWAVYDAVVLNNNPLKVDKIVASLGIKVRPQDLRSKDSRNLLLSIFAQWLPLASSAFRAVIDKVPYPAQAQATRIPLLLHPERGPLHAGEVAPEPDTQVERDLCEGKGGDGPIKVAYVSKMFAVRTDELPENKRKPPTAEEMRERAKAARAERERRAQEQLEGVTQALEATSLDSRVEVAKTPEVDEAEMRPADYQEDSIIGFARLYSGTIKQGQSLYAVLPKYNTALPPSHPSNAKHLAPVKVEQLYLIMGRELVAVDEVPAGSLFGMRGLEGVVGRNATLCAFGGSQEVKAEGERDADKDCLVNLAGVVQSAPPIVRVAIEPEDPREMAKLVEGLRMLNQADPCVETLVQETGEHVILTAGELHLERCLKDLRDRFAKIELSVSPPIVPFRETAISAPDMAPVKTADHPRGTSLGSLQAGLVTYTVRAVPLPAEVTAFLLTNVDNIKLLSRDKRVNEAQVEARGESAEGEEPVKPEEFWSALEELLAKQGKEWVGLSEQIVAFGPRRIGANLLVDKTEGAPRSLRKRLERQAAAASSAATPAPLSPTLSATEAAPALDADELATQLEEPEEVPEGVELPLPDVRELDENLDTAFQLAMARGPLCAEPVVGLAFFLEAITLNQADLTTQQVRQKWSLARGNLISSAQDAFKQGLLDWSPRLQLAMYSCDIQASGEVLGKVYGVVSKRRGRIVSEEMKEGTSFFTIRALLPVVESFGFANEIRTRTSGAASPQLVFHGYEIFDQDPFWVPTTEEELEDLGEKADKENLAKKYMDTVRRRKGMQVERKVVEHAEKQQTMKR